MYIRHRNVSIPFGMVFSPVRTMSGRFHSAKLAAALEFVASKIALKIALIRRSMATVLAFASCICMFTGASILVTRQPFKRLSKVTSAVR